MTKAKKCGIGGEDLNKVEYGIPEEIIEEVRLRADIVDTISNYVVLQRKGKNYLGLCPFHAEKTPSFNVNSEKQMFYCFGCHVGGNVFSFLMKKENLTFPESVEYLARRYGVTLPEKELSLHEREEQRKRRRWEEIHVAAAEYFQDVLLNQAEGEPGRSYFLQRGIDEETIRKFALGYAPARWDGLLQALGQRGVKSEELLQAGLVLESERKSNNGKRYYDRFRNRVIFSILDSRSRPIAFGGRVLDDSLPKYLNSPETAFFSKGHHLYGVHNAHTGIREQGFALLVEGYMDVIALQKVGFENTIASLGTALTKEQAKLLLRYTRRVVVCYDSDAAGIQAALRAGEILQESGLRVEVISLPDVKDPDEFFKAHSVSDFLGELERAATFIQFKYKTLTKEHLPQSIPEKADLIVKLAPDILKVKSPVEREGYERFLSLELGLTLEAVQREIESQNQKKPKKAREHEYSSLRQDISVKNRDNISRNVHEDVPNVVSVPLGFYKAERILLRLLLENPGYISRAEEKLGEDFWRVPEHQQIFRSIKEKKLGVLSAQSENFESKLAALVMETIDLSRPDQLLADCLRVIQNTMEEETVTDLQARMALLEKSGDMAGAMALLREIGERLRRGEK